MKFFGTKKIFLIILLVIAISGFGGIKTTHAALFGISEIISSVITFPVQVIAYIFGYIAKILFTLGGLLIELGLNVNEHLLDDASPVKYGWEIVLQFTNLGFVLAIIIIAFATILRRESYGMKKILWKLVVAALLVNFSLVIAGGFLNISQVLTDYFLSKATLEGQGFSSFAENFAAMFKIQAFFKVASVTEGFDDSVLSGVAAIGNTFGAGVLTNIASLALLTSFTLIGALVLLAVAIMLLIRYVYMAILLILLPAVWLAWIFPNTDKYWKEWWDKFIRWTFFPPIMIFFLYLDVYIMETQKEYVKGIIAGVNPVAKSSLDLTFGFDAIGNLIIIFGLVIGGLLVANKLSIIGAKEFYGVAQGANKNLSHWTGRLPLRAGSGGLKKIGGEKFGETLKTTGEEWSKKKWYNPKKWFAGGIKGTGEGIKKATVYKPPKEYATFWGSTWGGMKKGSGLFKKKKQQFKVMTDKGETTLEGETVEEKKEEKKA